MVTIACIGAGRMGAALVAGWVAAGHNPDHIVAADPTPEVRAQLAADLGVRAVVDPREAVRDADIVVLAVKPSVLPEVATAIAPVLAPAALVVSIAAGVRLATIEQALPDHPIVRAMPNTPALVGRAATAIAGGTRASEADLDRAEELLTAVGIVVRVDESDLDAVTALSGSGPAYVFLVAQALIAAGVEQGLRPEIAVQLVEQTLWGSAELLVRSPEDPAELRAGVTSPGGTTEAGVAELEARAVSAAIGAAVARATERSRELGDS
jgi:pyrroline-5-carboxylate reductase